MIGVQEGRIARSSAKKIRHNKVHTAKGLRDRRVRLSADTAIQFYDVQDRLGFDRATEAVDWLIQKAKVAIDSLFDASKSEQIQHSTNVQADFSAELPYVGNCSTWCDAAVDFAAADAYYQKILGQNPNQKSCNMFGCEFSSSGERFTWSLDSVSNHNDDSPPGGKLPLFQH